MPSLHKPDRNEPSLLLAKALDPGGGETLLIGLETPRQRHDGNSGLLAEENGKPQR